MKSELAILASVANQRARFTVIQPTQSVLTSRLALIIQRTGHKAIIINHKDVVFYPQTGCCHGARKCHPESNLPCHGGVATAISSRSVHAVDGCVAFK